MPWTLLTIPPEIRDVIIETVLLSSRPAPPDIATAALTRHTVVETWDYRNKPFLAWDYGIRNVKFEKPGAHTTSNALPLFLTNHQLNAETRSAIARLGDDARCYELDVMIVNEGELWPTWTCVPVLTHHIEKVEVTFRLYASQKYKSGYDALRGGDGSPPGLLWCFYFVLEHFLKRGSDDTFGVGERDKEISVKVIDVAFVAGEGQQMLQERPSWQRLYRAARVDTGNTHIMQPLWIAQMISGRLNGLLGMNYHTARYGAILHERVATIRVSAVGELLRELNIAQVLAKLACYDAADTFGHLPREDRLLSFWQWKKEAVRLRYERGLPIEENNVFEK